jgi:hypothetical protein
MAADYWQDRCPKCHHARAWHGEGGCNHELTSPLSYPPRLIRCGCAVRQADV